MNHQNDTESFPFSQLHLEIPTLAPLHDFPYHYELQDLPKINSQLHLYKLGIAHLLPIVRLSPQRESSFPPLAWLMVGERLTFYFCTCRR